MEYNTDGQKIWSELTHFQYIKGEKERFDMNLAWGALTAYEKFIIKPDSILKLIGGKPRGKKIVIVEKYMNQIFTSLMKHLGLWIAGENKIRNKKKNS